MMRNVLLAVCATLVLGSVWWLGRISHAQDTPKPPVRGYLYKNWKKLGLTDEQKQAVYKVQGNYRGQIRLLTLQIKKLKREEKIDAIKVLTKAQKERLKEVGSFEFRELLKEIEKPEPTKDK